MLFRSGGGRSILTTAGALGGGEHTGQLALLQPLNRRVPLQGGMGPLQPGRLGKCWKTQRLQHLGQTRCHPIGSLRVELTEGEAQPAVVADRQQGARLGAIVGGLAAAGLEQFCYLIGPKGAAEHLATQGKALLQRAQLQGHGVAGGRPQPGLQAINSPGLGFVGQLGQGLGSQAALVCAEDSTGLPGGLGEAGCRSDATLWLFGQG